MKNKIKKILLMLLIVAVFPLASITTFTGCSSDAIVIYTSSEDYNIEYMTECLEKKFPDYNIVIEYFPTGNHAAKLYADGVNSSCDITHDLEYAYLDKLDKNGILADLSSYNKSIYTDDTVASENYIIEARYGGGIILNTQVLTNKGLAKPTCYEDLLKPEYKNLISMASPTSSGTGYMFYKSLVNARGEAAAKTYFKSLTKNVLQYTSSGSGPIKALLQGEVAIGLGMLSQSVMEINQGAPLEIVFFDEGAPFTLYGQSVIKGKETDEKVMEVFDYLINEYNYLNNQKFLPEKIYKDVDYVIQNYPQDIKYADMSNNSITEKERLLEIWSEQII